MIVWKKNNKKKESFGFIERLEKLFIDAWIF